MSENTRKGVDRGIFSTRLVDGSYRYGITYLDNEGNRRREIVGSSIFEARQKLAMRRASLMKERIQGAHQTDRKRKRAILAYEQVAVRKVTRAKRQLREFQSWCEDALAALEKYDTLEATAEANRDFIRPQVVDCERSALMTIGEACSGLRVSRTTFWRMMTQGVITPVCLYRGGRRWIRRADVDALIRKAIGE